MDSGSVVSSISLAHSFDFNGRSAGSSSGRGRRAMVQQHPDHHVTKRPGRSHSGTATANNNNNDNEFDGADDTIATAAPHHHYQYPQHSQQHLRRGSIDAYQHSETISIGGVTDFSAERPATRDTSRSMQLMRDASALSGQPDKSNFREKLRHWTVLEDASSPLLAPRPTTSLASQKPSGQLLMSDVEREMTFLLSRPSTSNFPAKPKELIEPLDGLLPSESPVTQKKFLVLPSIGHGLGLRRQRSNLETINQLDYSRNGMENDADFFASYCNTTTTHNKTKNSYHNKNKHHRQSSHNNHSHHHKPSSPTSRPHHQTGLHKSGSRSSITHHHYMADVQESRTKAADTPLPLPPIPHHHPKHPSRRMIGPHQAEHTSRYHDDDDGASSSASCSSRDNRLEDIIYDTDLEEVDEEDEDEEDLDRFRQKTPETYRFGSPPAPITPPPGFR